MTAPERCVILVPVGGAIDPGCEDGLKELERRGHPVWRVRGYSAIDAARCQMATDALAEGFQELMWIDSDIVFEPDDVEKLRSHELPFTCGLYPKKGLRQFANAFHPGTQAVRFGVNGGLIDILYCGFGFTHTRGEVYDSIRMRLSLEECNRGFRKPLVPYFAPLVGTDARGDPWYLHEDYGFCERARRCGFGVKADTTIRLWHVGSYHYGWEDAGRDVTRYADYTFQISETSASNSLTTVPAVSEEVVVPPTPGYTHDWFSKHAAKWNEILTPFIGVECHVLEIGVFEGRSTLWLLEQILTNPDSTLTYVDPFTGGPDHAGWDLKGLEERFLANTTRHRAKLIGHRGTSVEVLRGLPRERYDFVSIDGSHEAAEVLSDAVLAWPLMKKGGLLCFDDYEWWVDPAPEHSPKLAVDSFLAVMRGRCTILHRGYQVWVRKDGE